MKQINKRLSLSKETLRTLADSELERVAGGVSATCCNSCTDTCESFSCGSSLSGSSLCTHLSACC